jgi:hypothetical protein
MVLQLWALLEMAMDAFVAFPAQPTKG